MDIWVLAGYLTKFLQNVVKDRELSSGSFSGNPTEEKSNFMHLISKELTENSEKRSESGKLNNCDQGRLFRRRVRRQLSESSSPNKDESSVNPNEKISEIRCLDVPYTNEMASTSGLNGDTGTDNSPDFASRWACVSNNLAYAWKTGIPPGKFSAGNGSYRGRSSFKSKWSRQCYSVRPMTSLESCLTAQMYTEHVEIEDYVYSSLPSASKATTRPFFVTDGNQVISRASSDSSSVQFEGMKRKLQMNEYDWREKETMNGVHPLHETGLIKLPRNGRRQRGKVKSRRRSISNSSSSGKDSSSQGSLDTMFFFCLGLAFGVMASIFSSKREVDNLNKLLKQSNNLVQDLQEELEMKDSLTVEELTNEAFAVDTKDPIGSLFSQATAAFCPDPTAEEKAESMSKIEAELQAELERLELNMSACLERRLSGLSESDSGLVAHLVHGELRADKINGGGYSDQDTSSRSTDHVPSANYSVSPKELSLRLHELIQSRLEERIAELETELKDSQRRLQLMESERMNSQRDFSNSELESSSAQESPSLTDQENIMDSPLFLNLSGDALTAYNEAYDEFTRIAEVECTPTAMDKSEQIDDGGLFSLDRSHFRDTIGKGENGSFPIFEIEEEDVYDELRTWEGSQRSNEASDSEEDNDYEFEKMLIKQIVEKTRQGSPVVLNAQKMLFSMDEQLPLE